MAIPARCLELQQALALPLPSKERDRQVEHFRDVYGVFCPLLELRAVLPHRMDLFKVEHAPDLPRLHPSAAVRCPRGSLPVPAAPLYGSKFDASAPHEWLTRVRGGAEP